MFRLPHKEEQLLSAASMIPGIFLAVYWAYTTKHSVIAVSALMYIVTCFGAMAYHTHCAYNPGYNPKWLRMDLTYQQLSLYTTAVLSPLGLSGAMLMLPIAIIIAMLNLSHIPSSYMALTALAIGILIVSSSFSIGIVLQWLVAFAMYSMKDYFPDSYTISQTLWHILGHVNVVSGWIYWTALL